MPKQHQTAPIRAPEMARRPTTMSPPAEQKPAPSPAPHPDPPFTPREFTEKENLPWTGITLLLAVLGLLLFMAVPMGNPSPQELLAAQRQHRAEMALGGIQSAVEDFHNDHGQWPGVAPQVARTLGPPVYDAAWLERQLSMSSDGDGWTAPAASPGFSYGPYLPKGVPVNPTNGQRSIRILREGETFDSVVDALYGWVYDPRSGEVRPHVLPFERLQRINKRFGNVGFRQ